MPESTTEEKIAEDLSRCGLRATRQRVAALQLLRSIHGHPTSAEVYDRLLAEHGRLSRKTVYEILDALVRAGLAARVATAGGPVRYESRMEPHDHAACRRCGRLYDVPLTRAGRTRNPAGLPAGFEVERVEVTIRGVCRGCRGDREAKSPRSVRH